MQTLDIGSYLIVKTANLPPYASIAPAVIVSRLNPQFPFETKRRVGDYSVETAHLDIVGPKRTEHVAYCATLEEAMQLAETTPLPAQLP